MNRAAAVFLCAVALTGCRPKPEEVCKDALSAYMRRDYRAAAVLFRVAADQGNVKAQSHLGGMYDDGLGVPKDYGNAFKWYRKAAEQGHLASQFNLGQMYAYGQGVSADNTMAYMWYSLAIANGNPLAAKDRDRLERQMTKGQIAEAQRLAREWKPKKAEK